MNLGRVTQVLSLLLVGVSLTSLALDKPVWWVTLLNLTLAVVVIVLSILIHRQLRKLRRYR